MSVALKPVRAELHASVSQIKTFLMCPRKYEYRYVLGAPAEHRSPNLVLGSAVHEALAAYYVALKNGETLTADELTAVFTDTWDRDIDGNVPLLLDDDETAGAVKDIGVALVTVFAENVIPPERILAVEKPFAIDVTDPDTGEVIEEQLVGSIDALVEIGGQTVILEHKTAARRYSEDVLKYDLQPGVYLAALPADHLRYQVLLKTKKPAFETYDVTRTEGEQAEALLILCRVLDVIRAGTFWPNRGWQCSDCEFRRRCLGGRT